MAIKMTIRIDVRCPAHRRANGNPEDTRASCDTCFALRRLRLSIIMLQDHLRDGEKRGLEFHQRKTAHVYS